MLLEHTQDVASYNRNTLVGVQVLPPLAPAPWRVPFLPPLPPPQEKTSLRPDRTPSLAVAAAMVGPLSNQTLPALPASGRRIDVITILLIIVVEVLLASVLMWLWITVRSRVLRKRCMYGKVRQDLGHFHVTAQCYALKHALKHKGYVHGMLN